MIRPKVTLVVPTFNRQHFLGELLCTASNQSVQYDAIIVVDDGSSDDTEQYVAQNFPDTIYIKTPNRGVQNARNTGMQVAQTEWITLCDSDDLIDTDYNKNITDIVMADPVIDQIYSNFKFFNHEGEQKDVFSKLPENFFAGAKVYEKHFGKVPDLLEKVLINQFLWPSGMTIRKSALDLIGPQDTNLRHIPSEDFEFTLRAIAKLNIALSRAAMIKIRKHGENESADSINQVMGEITILQKFLETTHFGFLKRFAIKQSIAKRSEKLVVGLYDRQRFNDIVVLYESEMSMRWSVKSRLKYTIAKVPFHRIRKTLWQLSRR